MLDSSPDDDLYIEAMTGIGDVYDAREQFNVAIKYYEKAFLKAEQINNRSSMTSLCFRIALIYDDIGDIENAVIYYKKNIEISDDYNENAGLSSSYANIAAILEESDNYSESIEFYEKSLEVDRLTGNLEGLSLT